MCVYDACVAVCAVSNCPSILGFQVDIEEPADSDVYMSPEPRHSANAANQQMERLQRLLSALAPEQRRVFMGQEEIDMDELAGIIAAEESLRERRDNDTLWTYRAVERLLSHSDENGLTTGALNMLTELCPDASRHGKSAASVPSMSKVCVCVCVCVCECVCV